MGQELPNELLIEIGFFATDWAVIEQEVMLHASALAAQDTDGEPKEHLRLEFRRLRRKWYELAREKLPPSLHREIDLLNNRLARRAEARGYALHGIWTVVGPRSYRVDWWEQRTSLEKFTLHTTYDQLREQTDKLRDLRCDLVAFMMGAPHDLKHRDRAG